MFGALFCRLQGEAIRLVFQPEQSHERVTPQDFTAASTHDRRDADAQARAQDPRRLHSRSPSLHPIFWAAHPIRPRPRICAVTNCTASIRGSLRSR